MPVCDNSLFTQKLRMARSNISSKKFEPLVDFKSYIFHFIEYVFVKAELSVYTVSYPVDVTKAVKGAVFEDARIQLPFVSFT